MKDIEKVFFTEKFSKKMFDMMKNYDNILGKWNTTFFKQFLISKNKLVLRLLGELEASASDPSTCMTNSAYTPSSKALYLKYTNWFN